MKKLTNQEQKIFDRLSSMSYSYLTDAQRSSYKMLEEKRKRLLTKPNFSERMKKLRCGFPPAGNDDVYN